MIIHVMDTLVNTIFSAWGTRIIMVIITIILHVKFAEFFLCTANVCWLQTYKKPYNFAEIRGEICTITSQVGVGNGLSSSYKLRTTSVD